MDEESFMLGVLTSSKRMFSERLYKKGKIKAHIQGGNREWITLLACIYVDGSALDPAIMINQPQAQYRTAGFKRLTLWITKLTLPHYLQAERTIIGLSKCSVALQWLRLDRATERSSLMAMDLIYRWILSTTAIM
jgi:hypothetical protein